MPHAKPRVARAAAFGCILFFIVVSVRNGISERPSPAVFGSELRPAPLAAAEFGRLVRDFSEPSGYFHSDNFISNERSYLDVVSELRDLQISGGAYLGVGPEQNFTYIAKVRPDIAFIIDIRRQAAVQHLMYKAIFHLSDTRAEFLSRLLSRPLQGGNDQALSGPVGALIAYFTRAQPSHDAFSRNLQQIKRMIVEEFHCPLSDSDEVCLERLYKQFRDDGLGISYWADRMSFLPSLQELLEQTEPSGNGGSFLADNEEYAFVRELQLRNRIIPIVGDFAGPTAVKSVGSYLRSNSQSVTAIYISNVEEYLFLRRVFALYAENLKALPLAEKAVLIRADPSSWRWNSPPPAARTVMQRISVFLKHYEEGLYTDFLTLFDPSE